MDLAAYFDRIQYHPPHLRPCRETLVQIHQAQLERIAFENIDIYCSQPPEIDVASVWQKIVVKKHGGYCFELNTLLCHVLNQMGFRAEALLARRLYQRPQAGPKTHILLKVQEPNDDVWLCDVGFGGLAFIQPLPFQTDVITSQFNTDFKITSPTPGEFIVHKKDDEWQPLYTFSNQSLFPGDLEMSHFFTSQHPTSNFRKKLTIVRCTPTHHVSIIDRVFTETSSLQTRQISVTRFAQFAELLSQNFFIENIQPHERLEALFKEHSS